MGSGALSGLMLDLGFLKIIAGSVFFPISSPCGGEGGFNKVGPYPNPSHNHVG